MAKPSCTFCEQYEGVLMATNLDDGDTQVACGTCLPGYALGMAAGIVGQMSKSDAEQYADAIDQVYASDPRGPKPPPASKGRRPRQRPPAEQPAGGSQSQPAESVALIEPCAQCGSQTATGDAEKLVCDGCGTVIATASDLPG